MKNKKGLAWDMLVRLIIIAVIIGVLVFIAVILKVKNINAIAYIQELFKFG